MTWHWGARVAGAIGLVGVSVSVHAAPLPPGNAVQQWNTIAENTVVSSGAFQNEGLIYMAYVTAATYDAAVSVYRRYEPFAVHVDAAPGASADAAVIEAAYEVLRHYFHAQATVLDSFHADALALIGPGPGKDAGIRAGAEIAAKVIARRANDGLVTPIAATSSFDAIAPGPGVWRLTPPAFAAPQTPWVGDVRPFILNKPGQFHVPPPVPLTSMRWVEQFNDVKLYGGASSAARSTEQANIARFWTANVIRQYNRLGRDLADTLRLDLVETARLLAMINVVGADAQIEVMHWKYHYLFWRPVTAIDPSAVVDDGFGPVPGFDDGNLRTVEEPGWRPLIASPNHPEYPGAHGSITGAVAQVLSEFLGTDQINLDIRGFNPAGDAGNLDTVRHFASADVLTAEIVDARLWAGLHYRASTEAGVDLGRKVAHYDLNHAFRTR